MLMYVVDTAVSLSRTQRVESQGQINLFYYFSCRGIYVYTEKDLGAEFFLDC